MTAYVLRLFVSGKHGIGARAERNVREHLKARGVSYDLEIIDVLEDPQAAEAHGVMVVPSLDRVVPEPMQRVVGFPEDYAATLDLLDVGQT